MPTRLIAFLILTALVGCNKPSVPAAAPGKLVEVVVDYPTIEDITDTEEFPGRLEPVDSVVVRSRVTGYLNAIHFVDGEDVPKGKLLFTVDPLPYLAVLERAQAEETQARAKRDRLKKDYARVMSASLGAVSNEERDRIEGDLAESEAAVKVAVAAVKIAQTNVDYTRITALTAGRIGRRMVDPGNLVKADETILATIVALDSVYATFDVDERTLLHLRRLLTDWAGSNIQKEKIVIGVGLSDETGFSHTGVIDFTDNQVNPRTGSIRVRALLSNADKFLAPGLYVRLRFPIGKPHKSILVPEEAIGSDQGQKYVFLVNEKDEVVYRKVLLGPQSGKNRVIESGLKVDDRVIVSGLQRVRAGVKVTAKPVERTRPEVVVQSQAITAASGGR
ncbi:MAG TPA: efflux RND transporter periplasmic adaptor subunit [Fimbriiglobus sp.]|jgi:RND family efflux transporter MFP subunit